MEIRSLRCCDANHPLFPVIYIITPPLRKFSAPAPCFRTAVSRLTNRLISLRVVACREYPELRTKLWKLVFLVRVARRIRCRRQCVRG